MPSLGEKTYRTNYPTKIWSACTGCGKERWVIMHAGEPRFLRCQPCAGRHRWAHRSVHWRGGRVKTTFGYIESYVQRGHPLFDMAIPSHKGYGGGGYIKEHRLVMAQHLGRSLHRWEVVHHINGVKDDNRIENLELLANSGKHNTQIERELKRQAQQIKELQARVTLLEAERVLANIH